MEHFQSSRILIMWVWHIIYWWTRPKIPLLGHFSFGGHSDQRSTSMPCWRAWKSLWRSTGLLSGCRSQVQSWIRLQCTQGCLWAPLSGYSVSRRSMVQSITRTSNTRKFANICETWMLKWVPSCSDWPASNVGFRVFARAVWIRPLTLTSMNFKKCWL